MVLSLAALAWNAGEVGELLGEVNGLELFMTTEFQRHFKQGATRACACISCGLHTLDDYIPCPCGAGSHDVGCEGCVTDVNLFTTLEALMVHAKARGAQVPSVLLLDQSDEIVDVAGDIAERCCRFKDFHMHLTQLVVEHDFYLEESKDQKKYQAIFTIDYKVQSTEKK